MTTCARCPANLDVASILCNADTCTDCERARFAPSEWAVFRSALLSAAVNGVVHQAAVRPLIRGKVAPKHIGTMYRRAKAEGLLCDTGEREPSNDRAGRNLDKLDRVYALAGAA